MGESHGVGTGPVGLGGAGCPAAGAAGLAAAGAGAGGVAAPVGAAALGGAAEAEGSAVGFGSPSGGGVEGDLVSSGIGRQHKTPAQSAYEKNVHFYQLEGTVSTRGTAVSRPISTGEKSDDKRWRSRLEKRCR